MIIPPVNVGKYYNYSDICLVPRYSDAESREFISTWVKLGDWSFKVPVVPANMKCVIDFEKAEELMQDGYFYILHRFYENDEIIKWCKKINFNKPFKYFSLSVGVNEKDYKFIDLLIDENIKPEFITVDIAHGHSFKMKCMVEYIKEKLPDTFIIGGNVATLEAVNDLKKWGCHAAKVGIANGASCITYNKTGVGTPMFTTVQECSRQNILPIIADGGIRENGDVAKALTAGAIMVMIGSKFAELIDSPAEIINEHESIELKGKYFIDTLTGRRTGVSHKIFYGSASEYNKDTKKNIEGKLIKLPLNIMTYSEKMKEIEEDLQSTISYLGGSSLDIFHEQVFYAISN